MKVMAKTIRRSSRLLKRNLSSTTKELHSINASTTPKKTTKTSTSVQKVKKNKSNVSKQLSHDYEKALYKKGFKYVVGVDEAGRGPLAGPVVAACCYIPPHVIIPDINDSKGLTEEQRETIYEALTSNPEVKYSVYVNESKRIDEINILQATLEAMAYTVEKIPVECDFALIDGNRMPKLLIEGNTIVKGDSKVLSIAAASVIAKVTRDRLMVEYHEKWPEYNFKQHKGYPTRQHMASVHEHGPCPIHRLTFAPLKHMDFAEKAE